jgi:hypothetical protein
MSMLSSLSWNYKKYSPTAEACPAADGTNLFLKAADKLGSELALKINCRRGMGLDGRRLSEFSDRLMGLDGQVQLLFSDRLFQVNGN